MHFCHRCPNDKLLGVMTEDTYMGQSVITFDQFTSVNECNLNLSKFTMQMSQ